MFAVLMRGRKTDNAITYDEFVKEFLLKGRVKEITMTEKGRIYVEILNGGIGPISVTCRLREQGGPQGDPCQDRDRRHPVYIQIINRCQR